MDLFEKIIKNTPASSKRSLWSRNTKSTIFVSPLPQINNNKNGRKIKR
ncbi:hypothetical protein SAMN05661044_04425 [Olivibacter domesticus]|uniref:Uncharacterized protein n=1 Tax=Olivibacter domesticus TaxID=407022 RepID=A0A1H7W6W1_OLID1|nr:hypothetical protein SAMN05661044_04425 [Olivibacter domesticus]